MVLHLSLPLASALERIEFIDNYQKFPVHEKEAVRTDDVLQAYGQAKWNVVDTINEQYSTFLTSKFDLYNWLHENKEDEVAYFLNEAGSNCLCYSEFKAPFQFHLWLGKKGFIIGVEQKGQGFPAEKVLRDKIKDNKGAAFTFYQQCRSRIFFDRPKEARIVYLEFTF